MQQHPPPGTRGEPRAAGAGAAASAPASAAAGAGAPCSDLHRAATAALAAMGAEVRCFADADNCVRPREPGEPVAAGGDATALPFVIEVQGTPNLLHELAHVVLLGRVAKDHATDYRAIPFDLTTARGRALLFEELACCSTSAAWHEGSDEDARAWFAEQVAIQECFFDEPGALPRFLAAAQREIAAHAGELAAMEALASERIETALRGGGLGEARARRSFRCAAEWPELAVRLAR